MANEIEHILSEIEFLAARKCVAKRELLPKDEYIDLLNQIEKQYNTLASLYMKENEKLFACQALLHGANILFEICEQEPNKVEKSQLQSLSDYLIELAADCYDFDISRNAFVAIGQLCNYLGDYATAEEYIKKAYDDYDYSVSTFQLYMKVLDTQRKYKTMLTLMENYLNMGTGFHDKCYIESFFVPNILHSPYASTYESLFS